MTAQTQIKHSKKVILWIVQVILLPLFLLIELLLTLVLMSTEVVENFLENIMQK